MTQSHVALFVVGAPGVGKTVALRSLLPFYYTLHVKPKWTLSTEIALVGHYGSGTFDGGDTVPYNGGAEAVNFWRTQVVPSVGVSIFDGDRFSHQGAKAAVESAEGVTVGCVHLTCEPGELKVRRSARKNTQNASWMAGRETKAKRFASMFGTHQRLELDTSSLSVREVASEITSFGWSLVQS